MSSTNIPSLLNRSVQNIKNETQRSNKDRKPQTEMDKDAFLKVLIAQMTHQDPMSPMEDTQFIAQMAQFSALEQSMQANNTATAARAEGMIGKEIVASAVMDSTGTLRPADIYGKVVGTLKVNGKVFLQLEKGYMVPLDKVLAVYEKIPDDLVKPDPGEGDPKPELPLAPEDPEPGHPIA